MTDSNPILLFDGVCNLCNKSVQKVLTNEKTGKSVKQQIKFASLQSDFAKELLIKHNKDPEKLDSLVFIVNGKFYDKTRAVFKICSHLKFPYPLIYFFWPIPYFMRDWVYNWVAKNRYKWYGKQEECWLPTPEMKSRFIA